MAVEKDSEVGRITEAKGLIKVLRGENELILEEGAFLHLNDIVRAEQFSVKMSFYNGLNFELEPQSEVLLDEPFASESALNEEVDEDNRPKDQNPLSETDQYANEHMYVQASMQEGQAHAQGLNPQEQSLSHDATPLDKINQLDQTPPELITNFTIPPITNQPNVVITIPPTGPGIVTQVLVNGHIVPTTQVPGQPGNYIIPPLPAGNNNIQISQTHNGGTPTLTNLGNTVVDLSAFAKDDHATATEGQGPTSTKGNVLTNDEHGDKVTTGNVVGKYGTYHFHPDGSYTYELDNTNPAVNTLAHGTQITDPVAYSVVDAVGNTASATLTTTITGTNANPIMSAMTSQALHEGDAAQTGHVSATDTDRGDTLHYSTTASHSGFILKPDGTYVIDPTDSSFNHLAVGEKETIIIPIIATDNHGGASLAKDLTITITGTNDAPTVSSAVVLPAGTEDKSFTVTQAQLLANVTDVDTTDVLRAASNITSAHAIITGPVNGVYTVTPDANYHGDLSLTYYVTDTHGGVVKATATATLSAVNDAAVITNPVIDVTEDSHTAVQTKLAITDIDAGEGYFQAGVLTGAHGYAVIDGSGNFLYKLDNSAAQHLNVGQTITDTITVTSADGTTHDVSVSIHGTNDIPVIGAITSQSATEDGSTVTGKITSTDVDTGDSASYTTTSTQAGFILNKNGTYSLDPTNASFQHLADGQTQTLTIPVVATDSHSGTSVAKDLVITITGTNDIPTVSAPVTLAAGTEDTDVIIHASDLLAHASDVDHGAVLSVHNLSADHGKITDNGNGTFTFHPDQNYNGKVQFTYEVQDKEGASVATTASMDLAAVADAAVITGTDTGSITEDHNVGPSSAQTIMASGTLSVIDPDAGQDHFRFSQLGEKAIHDPFGGSLHITPSGGWGYEVHNSNLQYLKEGDTEQVVYRVYSADYTPHDITITVTGTNDAPVVSSAVTLASGTEDTDIVLTEAQLLANASDVDYGETNQLSVHNLSADHGTITDNKDGTFTFHPDANYNGKVSFTYEVQDPHGASVTTTATTNLAAVADSAVIAGVDTGDVYEHQGGQDVSPDYAQPGIAKLGTQTAKIDGKLTINDSDLGENTFDTKGGAYNNSYHGQYGVLLLNADGAWHYSVNLGHENFVDGRPTTTGTTIDQLGAGEILTDTVTVYSKDGTAHDIVITIHGDNDAPYCSSEVHLNSGTEDTAMTLTSAQLLHNTVDVDANDAGKLSIQNLHADHGSILDNKDGTYTFTPAKDYNGQVHFTYDVHDAHGGSTPATAMTNLAAVNDAAVITNPVIDVTEDSHTAVQTKLAITDIDPGEGHFQAGTLTGAHGYAVIDGSGNFLYKLDNSAAQHLNVGQTITDTITVRSADGTTHDVSVTIHGTNDKPVIGAITAQSVNEDGSVVTGSITSTDVDTGDTATYATTSTQAGFTLNTNGTYTLDPKNAAFQHLAAGETQAITIAVTATDTHSGTSAPQNLVITITGTNDIPKVSAPVTLPAGTEDLTQTITSTQLLAHASDIDATDTLSVQNVSVDHGTITTDASGTIHFTPEANYNGKVTFNYEVTDSHGGVVSTTATTDLAAVNDAAVIAGHDSGGVTEDTSPTTAGQLSISDIDSGEAHFASTSGSTRLGTYTIDASGHWTYTLDPGVQSLHQGDTMPDSFVVHGIDGTTHQVKIVITGTADAPIVTGDTSGTVIEDTHTMASGQLHASDKDHGQSGFWAQSHIASSHGYGEVSIDRNGQWTFSLDPSNKAVQALGATQSLTDTITVNTTDGHSQVITITINGTNDRLEVSGTVSLAAGTEDTDVLIQASDLLIHSSDIDTGDTLSIHNLTSDHGKITDNQDGTFTFHPSQDYNGKVTFTYDVQDQHGLAANSQATATMDLAAVSDAAVITGDGKAIIEDHGVSRQHEIQAYGTLHVMDPDGASESKFEDPVHIGLYHGSLGGHLQVNPDGQYFYTVNNDALFYLSEGQVVKDHFMVHSIDGTTHALDFTITGTNDTPDIYYNYYATYEDGAISHGQIKFRDDALDTHTFSVSNPPAGFHLDKHTGAYTFDPSNHAYQHLSSSQVDNLHFDITIRDNHGASSTRTMHINVYGTDDTPSISIDVTDTTDNVLNAQEASSAEITGSISAGATLTALEVTDTLGHKVSIPPASLHVDPSGNFSLSGVDLSSLVDGQLSVSATARSVDGTTATSTDTIIKDSQVGSPRIFFESPGADNVYNASEVGSDGTVTATIHPLHVKVGDVLHVSNTDTGVIQDITLTQQQIGRGVQIEVKPGETLQASITDNHGNTSAQVSVTAATGDTQVATPTLSLRVDTGSSQTDGITGDGRLDVGNLEQGARVEYSTDNGRSWSSSFTPIEGSNSVQVHQIDTAGNVSTPAQLQFTLDTSAPTISIDAIATDDIVNAQEHNTDLMVTGKTTASVGENVTVNFEGHIYNPQVTSTPQGNVFSVSVPANIVATLQDGHTSFATADVSDGAGNHATQASRVFSTDIHADALHISFDSDGSDGYYQAGELHANGKLNAHIALPQEIKVGETVSVNGHDITVSHDQVKAGEVLYEVSPGERISVSYTDGAGNQSSPSLAIADSLAPVAPHFTTPPHIVGGQGSQSLTASLGIPPLVHQAIPTPQTGWGIETAHGGVVTSLHGTYGTLKIDPATGDLHYDYRTDSGVVKHGGSTSPHNEVDTFTIMLSGDENSKVAVDLHVQVQSIHGNSGHHIDHTTLTGMDITPLAPVQHDEPDTQSDIDDVTIHIDTHDAMPSLDHIGEHLQMKQETPQTHHAALVTAATLLGDTQSDSPDAKIIKAVETQEAKEHIKNPDTPEANKEAEDNTGAQDQDDQSGHGGYVPDSHNKMPDDQDINDGTGITD